MAAKWFIRHFGDGIVRRVPTAAEVSALEREFPGTTITIEVRTGDRLSLSIAQDSYSCVLAQVFTGGSTEASLQQTWDACVAGLPFEIDAVADDSP